MPPKTAKEANRQALIAIVLLVAGMATVAVVIFVTNIEAGGTGIAPPPADTTTTFPAMEDVVRSYRGRPLHCPSTFAEKPTEQVCDFVRFYMENTDLVPTTTTTTEAP